MLNSLKELPPNFRGFFMHDDTPGSPFKTGAIQGMNGEAVGKLIINNFVEKGLNQRFKDAFAIGAAKDALGTLLGEACANAKRATNNEGMDRENFKTLKLMVYVLRLAT